MEKVKEVIKKHWLLITIALLCIIRFIMSYKFSSFYLSNLRYDDRMMINKLQWLIEGKYLGDYSVYTLMKGAVFPIFLFIVRSINISYSSALTILYIFACLFFIYSLRKVINQDVWILFVFLLLIFNPVSYSSDLFQRLYRNCLSIIELLFFFGIVINIMSSEKNNILSYIFLGIIVSIMRLTRDDNMWTTIVLAILIIYKLYKDLKIKTIIINMIPVLLIIINLNIVSLVNLKKYNIYTYDELSNSYFKDAFKKVLEIKDDEKIDYISVPKSTFYKLVDNSEVFDFTREEIDKYYSKLANKDGEIYNGNIIWYFRFWIYKKHSFKDGKEVNEYFKRLSDELDNLFEEGKLEKEFALPSIFMNMPTLNEIKNLPKNLVKAIIYTSTYKNVKTFSNSEMEEIFTYDDSVNAYSINYVDYHNAENIIERNKTGHELIRNTYKYFTIILSVLALVIYLKNIKTKDKLNLIIHIILITYLIIICGVTYTHTTAFDAIRYCYLANVYILQNIFILLNLYRYVNKLRE
ncbi:MAG: hypothetical protein IKG56_05185 [Clostridia bacterium]|nr:hypothetical protein [Clostridia bacterium]